MLFGLRGNLDFPDFLQKKFYNINSRPERALRANQFYFIDPLLGRLQWCHNGRKSKTRAKFCWNPKSCSLLLIYPWQIVLVHPKHTFLPSIKNRLLRLIEDRTLTDLSYLKNYLNIAYLPTYLPSLHSKLLVDSSPTYLA